MILWQEKKKIPPAGAEYTDSRDIEVNDDDRDFAVDLWVKFGKGDKSSRKVNNRMLEYFGLAKTKANRAWLRSHLRYCNPNDSLCAKKHRAAYQNKRAEILNNGQRLVDTPFDDLTQFITLMISELPQDNLPAREKSRILETYKDWALKLRNMEFEMEMIKLEIEVDDANDPYG